MNFLVDAHLPRRLVRRLQEAGHDARHTLDLSDANRTTDTEILRVAAAEQRIVVTKDADFVHSHLLQGQPSHLLLISTGTIADAALESVFLSLLPAIENAFATSHFLEVTWAGLLVHS